MRKHSVYAAVLVLGSVMLVPAQAEPAKAFEGRKLFNSNCYLCHGVDGKGSGPLASKLSGGVSDLTKGKAANKSDLDLARVIQGTAPHGGRDMPKWNKSALPDPDVNALVTYVRFLQKSEHQLTGDPELGRKVYARYCVVCHGEGGKGDGPMTGMLDIQPADHTNARQMNRMTNSQIINYIANGGTGKTYMPAWEGILSREEMDATTGYIRLLSYK